jgi:hypothetical protein
VNERNCLKLRIFPEPLVQLAPKQLGLGVPITTNLLYKNESNRCISAKVIANDSEYLVGDFSTLPSIISGIHLNFPSKLAMIVNEPLVLKTLIFQTAD